MSGILPLGFGFLRVKVSVGFGLGSAFRGRVGFEDQNVWNFPLGFSGFRVPDYITMAPFTNFKNPFEKFKFIDK